MAPDLLQQVAEKSITRKELLAAVEKDFTLLPTIIMGVASTKANVRYSCASALVNLTETQPQKLYANIDFFVSLLDSTHRILKWNGMAAIANLCTVDANKKFDAIFDKYYGFIHDEYMVTVANAVGNSARIARAKPYLVPRITAELLRANEICTTPHLTEECTKVIVEKAVDAFDEFFDLMDAKEKTKVLAFVKNYVDSSRMSLRKDAQAFLKKHAS